MFSACAAFEGTELSSPEPGADAGGPSEPGPQADASSLDAARRPARAPADAALAPNGHAYQVVVRQAVLTWKQAKVAAEDLGGHLATITDADEQAFVRDLLRAGRATYYVVDGERRMGPWLGGTQVPDASEPGGGWSWITGEPWGYTHWRAGEPNNGGTGSFWNEASLYYFFAAKDEFGDEWADGTDIEGIKSFVVEWEP